MAPIARLFALVLLIAAASTFDAQSVGKSNPAATPRQAAGTPLSAAEASGLMVRVRSVVFKVVSGKAPTEKAGTPAGSATRVQLIRDLHKLYSELRPHYRMTPKSRAFESGILSIPAGSPERRQLEELIAWGFVDRVGVVATANRPNLTAEEWGDAVGFFLNRLAILTHTPSAKFTPALMPEE